MLRTARGGYDMKPISAGDLVMLVRWPHKCAPSRFSLVPGEPFIVGALMDGCVCHICLEQLMEPTAMVKGRSLAYPLSWLKRLDPPAQSETTTEERGLTV